MERVKYILHSVKSSPWMGISRFSGASHGLGAAVDTNGAPITGLTEDHEEKNRNGNMANVPGTRSILEKEMYLPEGHLRKGTAFAPNPFWNTYVVPIPAEGLHIDATIPEDYLKLLFLVAQPNVEVGYDNQKSMTEYIIVSPEAEAAKTNASRSVYREAVAAMVKSTAEQRAAVLYVMGVNPKGKTDDMIFNLLDDEALNKPEKIKELLSDTNLTKKAFVNRCVFARLLKKNGTTYKYNETVIGNNLSEAVEFLSAEENSEITTLLNSQL